MIMSYNIDYNLILPDILFLFQADFDGNCILYGDISWKNETFFLYNFSSSNANCSFGIYFAVFACIFYGLAMAIYYAYAITRKDPNIG